MPSTERPKPGERGFKWHYGLKKVIPVGTIELSITQATVLENGVLNRRGRGRSCRVFDEFLVPMHDAIAAFDLGFGWIALAPLAG